MAEMIQSYYENVDPSTLHSYSTTPTYYVVSTIGYLIGVNAIEFQRGKLMDTIFTQLEGQAPAKIIRSLCRIRTAIFHHYGAIYHKLAFELQNLNTMPAYIDQQDISYLESQNIPIIKANCQIAPYIAHINKLIADRIGDCQDFSPNWLEWKYVRDLFIMPGGQQEKNIRSESKKFNANRSVYPFQCYINWTSGNHGNLLYNDGKFVSLLYQENGDSFHEYRQVTDASAQTKRGLYNFVITHKRIAMVVDCENADPYKLCAVLKNIHDLCGADADHVQKIILFDDPHTVHAWRILDRYVSIPVEHEMVERVNDYKSLVDIRMTAGTCKEYYQNGIDAFLIVSSDSDYWGLISALPNVDFLVLLEYSKCGVSLRNALDSAEIAYCHMDDFATGAIDDIRMGALRREMESYLEENFHLNIPDMLEKLLFQARMELSPTERENFIRKYVRTLRLAFDDEGHGRLEIVRS